MEWWVQILLISAWLGNQLNLLLDSLPRSTLDAQELPLGGGTFVAQGDSDAVELAVMLMIPIITVQEDTVKRTLGQRSNA